MMRAGHIAARVGPTLADLPTPPEGCAGWPWTTADARVSDVMPGGAPWPALTIVTPSLNQGAFLEQAIRSVLLQGYPLVDLRIVDGGSTDGSVGIIRKYGPWLAGWVSEPDRGQSHAINKGFTARQGSWCSWLNADDFLLPGALAEVARAAQSAPAGVAVVGGCQRVLSDGALLNVIQPRGLTRHGLADWSGEGFFYQPSCFVATRAIDEAGPLDETLHYAFDLDWWLRLSALGAFVATNQVLAAATIHDRAKTQLRRLEMHAEILAVQVRHGFLDCAASKLDGLLRAARDQRASSRFWRMVRRQV